MKMKKHGFTLVEIILVLALISIVTIGSYSIFFTGQKSFEVGIDKGRDQADLRILREYLAKELRYINIADSKLPDKETVSKYSILEIKKTPNNKQLVKGVYNNIDKKIKGESIIPVYFSELTIEIKSGTAKIEFSPVDSRNIYEFSITLENNRELNNGKLLDSSNEALQIMYYAYPQDIK